MSKKGIHGTVVGVEEGPPLRGDFVQLLRPVAGVYRDITELLEERQGWIDDARAGAVGAGDLLLDRFDDFVPVPRLLGDEVQDNQAKIAVGEEAAEASSSSLSLVPVMTDVDTVLGVLFAAEAAAVIAVGMSMQLDSPSVFRH